MYQHPLKLEPIAIWSLVMALSGLWMACDDSLLDRPQLVASASHTCSADGLDGVVCWGSHRFGETDVPLRYRLADTVVAVAAGLNFTCAATDADVECWGRDDVGQASPPRRLLAGPSALAAGDRHACALYDDEAVCWGSDAEGQVSAMPRLRRVSQIAAGGDSTCALTREGVLCWGGALEPPADLRAPRQLAVGSAHACALDGDAVRCWGDDSAGQISSMPNLSAPSFIAAGGMHTCAVHDGGVVCWGGGAQETASVNLPRDLTFPTAVAVGGTALESAHACAYHLQGVACWGEDSAGQTQYPGTANRTLYRSEAIIAASPEEVWAVLDDLDAYPEWNPFTVGMESDKRVGSPMVMQVNMSGQVLEQTEFIRVWEPNYKMCWGVEGDLPRAISGERCQWLEPLPDGTTRFVNENLIAGTTTPLVTLLYGASVASGVQGVARELKRRVEER